MTATRTTNWFLSFHPHLLAVAKKPAKFDSWTDWDNFNIRQKFFILTRAGVSELGLQKNQATLEKLIQSGYKQGWRWSSLYPVFWGVAEGSMEITNTCNLFVGDILYLMGIDDLNSERKYYSARQIWNGNHPRLKLVTDKKKVKRGDVAAFRGTHVEVVTGTYENFWGMDAFCSRGGFRNPVGGEKCGSEIIRFWKDDRLQAESYIRFFSVR
jgi:hypothetical protein